MPTYRLPPTHGQICVIAREQIEAAPTIDDFEWKDRIKRRLLALGFAYPARPEHLTAAMDAVQRALERQRGQRPVARPERRQAAPARPTAAFTRTEAARMAAIVLELFPQATRAMPSASGSRSSGFER